MATTIQDRDILQKIGIRVPASQIAETMALIMSDPQLSKQVQSIRSSMATMTNQDQFIQTIVSSHHNIAQIPQNSKVIQTRDSTFSIRAINPQNIKSLTERAFFNSFNLERNVLNDLEQEILLHKNNSSYRPKEGKQRVCNQNPQNRARADNQEEEKCICGKNLPGLAWIQCSNEEKCRGSNWYHVQCAGLDSKDCENLKDFNFTCELCKRQEMDDQSGGSQIRKRKDQESGR